MRFRYPLWGAAVIALLMTTTSATAENVDVDDMTPRQRLDFSENTVDEVKGHARGVLKMVEEAQKSKDTVWLNCLNEKLAGLKALLKVVEDADLATREALARENNDLADHEFQKIVMARQQAAQLMAEADACIRAAGTSYAGRGRWAITSPDVEEDDSQYESDPTGYTRPPEASPFT